MEPRYYDEIPVCKVLTSLEVRNYWRNKEDGMQNRSGNCRCARVALRVHPTYTHGQEVASYQLGLSS
jgi:hypothetical protein